METLQVIILTSSLIYVTFACSGYTIKDLEVTTCPGDGGLVELENLRAELNSKCEVKPFGTVKITQGISDCNVTYVVEKAAQAMMPPVKITGQDTVVRAMRESKKNSDVKAMLNAADIKKTPIPPYIKKSLFQDRKKSQYPADPGKNLPAFGRLDIQNYPKFLEAAKDKFFERYDAPCFEPISMEEFRYLFSIGEGAFGKVKVVKRKSDKSYYAAKVFDKSCLVEMGRSTIALVLNERRILQSVDHPLIIRLEYFSQDNSNIYYIMPYVNGGELYTHIRKNGKCSEELTRFYGAQVLLAMEFLQYMHFVHRDIKPENILVDASGFVKLADFSLGKRVINRTFTFCGTLPYLAPEVINGNGYGRSADWWSFGVLLYEMASGHPPFMANTRAELLTKICYYQLQFKPFFSKALSDILRKLIHRDVTHRYGTSKGGVDDIKKHKFFDGVNWMSLLNRSCEPPFLPTVSGPADVSNFPQAKRQNKLYITETDHFHEHFKDF